MRSRSLTTSLAAITAIGLLAAACGGGDPAAAPPTEESPTDETRPDAVEVDEEALQAILDQWRTDVDADGATLSLRVPGHEDIHLASGTDDRDPETPMPTDGTFGVGSVTKTFVAATAFQLVDEGVLSLDETVETWLPELPHADEVTLAMLLGHTAGLGTGDNDELFADLARSYTPEEALALQLQLPPAGQPGERFAYTNAGYTAVGVLIERVLDQDLATVIAERFAEPLALQETHMDNGSVRATRHAYTELAPGTWVDWLDTPEQALTTSTFGAGNMISSSADLLDWGESLYSGEVLGPEATATMLDLRSSYAPDPATGRLVATDEPTRLHYGLGAIGFCLEETGCSPDEVEVVGHGGSDDGHRTVLAHHPASGTTLVLFANRDGIVYPAAIGPLTEVFEQLGLA